MADLSRHMGLGPTGDADQAMTYLKPFGSVTVLNGHIHQVVQKVEGKVTFQTAMSTAFPQPAAGTAPNPGPMKVPAEKLKTMLGIREIVYAPAPRLQLKLRVGSRRQPEQSGHL